MKKLVSLFLALLACVCLVAAALPSSGLAGNPDPAPKPTVTLIVPGNPDGTNTIPGSEDHTGTE